MTINFRERTHQYIIKQYQDLTNIVWSVDNLVRLWKFVSASKVRVDLSRALLEDGVWSEFFSQIQDRKSNITMLFWDENPPDGIVNILDNSHELIGLSVRRCFGEGDPNIQNLSNYIRRTHTLKYLSISGSRRKCLGNDTIHIIESLHDNRSITRLDISRNRAGATNIAKLGEVLMENQVLEIILLIEKNHFLSHGQRKRSKQYQC